jgi:hypothetical protein
MEAAQFWSSMPEDINEQSIIAITKNPSSKPAGYDITAITPSTPPRTDNRIITQLPKFLERYFLSHLPPHLRLPPDDIHILISTKSGTEQAATVFGSVLEPVLSLVGLDKTSYQVLRTESSDTVKEFASERLWERANDGVAQTVLLLSGDGGVVDIVNGLMKGGDCKSRYVLDNYLAVALSFVLSMLWGLFESTR